MLVYIVKFSYFLFKSEQVMDGKFDGTSFGKARFLSIRPEEQPNLISEIDSKGFSITPTESTPQLDVRSESGTIAVLTASNPAIRIQNRLRILQEARKRRQHQEARWRKQHNENASKLMLHMIEHAKTSSKKYLKKLYESFNRGEG